MATIVLPADKVIEDATKVIADIMAVRNKADSEAISRVIALHKNFSFRKGFYNKTEEQAKQWICDQGALSSWGFSIYAWGTLNEAKKLLKLAQHGDPVTLNQEDVNLLF
jgi:hypothetical protein